MTPPNDSTTQNALREAFDALLELPPAARVGWLESHVVDAGLRERLRDLLAAHDGRGFLDTTAGEHAARLAARDLAPEGLIGSRFGAFRLVRALGQGGMSAVFLGEREDADFRQQAAIKLLRRGLYSELEQRLFQRERRVLAALEHPNIARLIDGGVTAAGIPYLIMEFVDGAPITRYAEARNLDVRARVRLFVAVCRAVAEAHRNLIVHRDIKPSNILVATDGTVKLLDFGIAKLIEEDDAGTTGTVGVFTPDYAAPEQLRGGAITTATDVYGLGVLLHELLLGLKPQGSPTRRPSARVNEIADMVPARPWHHASLRKQLRGDLDNILLKALAEEPERRYASAATLADDIDNYLAGRAVVAHPPSRLYRARKFIQRHRGGVALTAVFAFGILAALGSALWQAQRTRVQAQRAEAVQAFLVDLFRANSSDQPDPVKARQTTARQLLDQGASKIDPAMADAPEAKLSLLRLFGNLYDELDLYDAAVQLRRREVDLARNLYGKSSRETAAALLDLAGSAADSNAAASVPNILLQVGVILDRRGDHTSALRGVLLRKQAIVYQDTDVPRAISYNEQSVRVFEENPPSQDLAESLANLGWLQDHDGRPRAAIASLQRAIDVVAALRIANDSNLPRYYAYLSDAQQHALDLADAERNARIALKRIQAINGDAPADTAYFQMRLGKLLWRTGRPREGIALLTRAEQFALQSGKGGDPQQVLWARYMRGVALARSGALAEGLNELRSAIAVCRQTQPDAVFLAEFLEETAYALTQTGGYDEAARLLAEAQQIRLDHKQHPGTPEFQANIAARVRLELAQAHVPQARSLFDDMRTQPGLAPLSWQQIEHDLLAARIALAQGQEDAAATHAAQVRARIEQAGLAEYLKEPLAQADLIGGLAALRKQQSSDALRLLQSALALRQQGLLASSPKIIQAQVALATAWLATGANAKAQALTASAAASAAQQTLGAQYGEPLRQLRASLQH